LFLEIENQLLPVPLLNPYWAKRLAGGFKVAAVRRHLEFEQIQACQGLDPDFDLEKLWHFTDQKELVGKRDGK